LNRKWEESWEVQSTLLEVKNTLLPTKSAFKHDTRVRFKCARI